MYGAAWAAPWGYFWFKWLSHSIPLSPPPVLPKLLGTIAIDQSISAPINLVAYLTTRGLIDGDSPRQIREKLSKEAFPLWSAGCIFWIPCSFVNFYLVPLKHRVTFVNLMAFFWNAYLATAVDKYHDVDEQAAKIEEHV